MEWIAGNIPYDGKLYVVATAFGKSETHYDLDVCYVDENGELCNSYNGAIYSHGIEDTTFYIPLPPLPGYKSRIDFLTEEQAACPPPKLQSNSYKLNTSFKQHPKRL